MLVWRLQSGNYPQRSVLDEGPARRLDLNPLSCYYSALGSRAVSFCLPSVSWGV